MADFIMNFHFLRPWLLCLVLLPIIMYKMYNYSHEAQSSWRKVIDVNLLDFLLVKGSGNKRKFLIWTALIGLIASVIILSGPSWQKKEIPVLQKQNPVVIMLNLSSDMRETDLRPNRLERAKYTIKDLLSEMTSTQTALGVYSSEPFIIVPFSDDTQILQNILGEVNFDIMPKNGDRLDRAIALGAERSKASEFEEGNLIIFTSDVGQKLDLAIDEAKKARADGILVNIIEVNVKNSEKLQMVADAGGGQYLNIVKDDLLIGEMIRKISQANAPIQQGENTSVQWVDNGWYLLIVPLLCCLVFFRRGILILILIMGIGEAKAGFFTNADQDGLKSFQEQNYDKAAENFKDNQWKAASWYRLGNFAEALKYYALNNDIEGLYNQGNALAKSGHINEAIAKYEEVLKLNPQHEDAKFNLEYLKQQQQQNQSPKQNKSESEQQNEQSENKKNAANEPNNDNQEQQDGQKQDEMNSSADENQQNNDASGEDSQEQQNNESKQPNNGDDNKENEDKAKASYELQQNNEVDEPKQDDQEKAGQAQLEDGKEENYDEKVQAKMLRYREIPEDPGGLLRAFIAREYQKNRYNER